MPNLLAETVDAISLTGKTPEQITFIGSLASGHSCTWYEYQRLANHEYDSGYGGQEVATDLVIVFSDGSFLDRREYDGSEWWEYHPNVVLPRERKLIERVICQDRNWRTLAEIADDEDKK